MKTRKKVTQREAIFYQLYKSRVRDPNLFVPIWKMIGEIYVPQVKNWGFVSYEVSARMSEMFKGNPELFERRSIKGKTGATYYGYRFSPDARPELIIERDLQEFYKLIFGKIKNEEVPNK